MAISRKRIRFIDQISDAFIPQSDQSLHHWRVCGIRAGHFDAVQSRRKGVVELVCQNRRHSDVVGIEYIDDYPVRGRNCVGPEHRKRNERLLLKIRPVRQKLRRRAGRSRYGSGDN
jgi:hypothetical protein